MAEKDQKLMEEVRVLEERLADVRKALEASGEKPPQERELLHRVVGERMQEAPPLSVPPAVVAPATPPAAPPSVHDEVAEVKEFVAMALEKDIPTAVQEIRKTGSAHLLDAFHDVLVDQFYDLLVRRGKITPS